MTRPQRHNQTDNSEHLWGEAFVGHQKAQERLWGAPLKRGAKTQGTGSEEELLARGGRPVRGPTGGQVQLSRLREKGEDHTAQDEAERHGKRFTTVAKQQLEAGSCAEDTQANSNPNSKAGGSLTRKQKLHAALLLSQQNLQGNVYRNPAPVSHYHVWVSLSPSCCHPRARAWPPLL